jgi:hypothetical protein
MDKVQMNSETRLGVLALHQSFEAGLSNLRPAGRIRLSNAINKCLKPQIENSMFHCM